MDNKLIQIVITITVGIVVLGSLLVPVITEASTTETKFTNDGYYFMTFEDEGTEMTVNWDYTQPTVLTVNSTEVPLPDKDHMSSIPFTIFCSKTWYLRYAYDNTDGYYVGIYQNANTNTYSGAVSAERSLTVTVGADGTTTVNNGTEHTWSNASGGFYVISETGEYVMKTMDSDAYVHGDSEIFGYGRTYARYYNYTSELSGSVNDGITGEFHPESTIITAGWTISDVTLNSETVSSYTDLYTVSSMTYEITGETILPYEATFSQFIVPYEITAEKSQHLDTAEIGLLAAIPVLMIVALLVITVRIFGGNRD